MKLSDFYTYYRVSGRDDPVPVFKNPDTKELKETLVLDESYGSGAFVARAFLTDNDLYIFNPYWMTHANLEDRIPPSKFVWVQLFLILTGKGSVPNVKVIIEYGGFDEDYRGDKSKRALKHYVFQHPRLRSFGNIKKIIVDF